MSKLVWLGLMFEFIVGLTLVVTVKPYIRRFNITVERNCQNERSRDSILAPLSAAASLKNLHCPNIANHGGRRTQCSCQKEETFIAHNITCVKNGFLVKINNCKRARSHKLNCDEPRLGNSPYITKNITMMDTLNRDISISRIKCRPSKTVNSKYLNCRGLWENVSFPIAYLFHQEEGFYEWLKTVTVEGKRPIGGYDRFREGLQGRLIKLALECKHGEDIRQECVLLKAKGSQTCQFQVTPRLPSTAVTETPLKSSTAHYLRDLDVKESTPAMSSSEVNKANTNLPTMRTRIEKESGNSNSDNVTTIVIGVLLGVCCLVIVVICFVFRKRLRNKKEVSSSKTRSNENELLDQQQCCYEEPNTTNATKIPCNLSYAVDLHGQKASQSVPNYESISEVQDTEYLTPVLKPEISSSEHYSSVEVSKDSETTPTYSNQLQNKVSVSHDQSIQGESSMSTELKEQNQRLRSSSSLMKEHRPAIADIPQKLDPIYSKPDKRDKRCKTKPEVFVETTCKTPIEIDSKQIDDAPATHNAPEKPLPYSSTRKKSFKKPKENEECDVNVMYETSNDLVTLAKPPLTELNVYDEAGKVLTEKESTVLGDIDLKAKEDLTVENLDTLTNSIRRHRLLSDSLSRNGNLGVHSDPALYDEPGKIISAEEEREAGY